MQSGQIRGLLVVSVALSRFFFYHEIHVASGGGTHRVQTSCVLNNSENFVENLFFEAEAVQMKSSNVIFSLFLCFVDMAADFYKSARFLLPVDITHNSRSSPVGTGG